MAIVEWRLSYLHLVSSVFFRYWRNSWFRLVLEPVVLLTSVPRWDRNCTRRVQTTSTESK